MEAARLQANELGRPWGHRGPTPLQAWGTRKPISSDERGRFARTVRACTQEQRMQVASEPRRLQREALRLALVRHGLLAFTSQRRPEPFPPRRRSRPPPDSMA